MVIENILFQKLQVPTSLFKYWISDKFYLVKLLKDIVYIYTSIRHLRYSQRTYYVLKSYMLKFLEKYLKRVPTSISPIFYVRIIIIIIIHITDLNIFRNILLKHN